MPYFRSHIRSIDVQIHMWNKSTYQQLCMVIVQIIISPIVNNTNKTNALMYSSHAHTNTHICLTRRILCSFHVIVFFNPRYLKIFNRLYNLHMVRISMPFFYLSYHIVPQFKSIRKPNRNLKPLFFCFPTYFNQFLFILV